MRVENLIEQAKSKPILCDGAMGTMLQSSGLPPGACPEIWNADRPEIVRSLHSPYIKADSRIITTNTFGGNRLKLEAFEVPERLHELNSVGASIARSAAGDANFVAGCIGPTGKFLEPLGDLSFDDATNIFEEQAQALAEGGADVILIETFSDLSEAKAAIVGALRTGIPCFCTMAFDTAGRTMMGVDPKTAAIELPKAGALAVGANCGLGPADTLEIIAKIIQSANSLIIAQPNAGTPKIVDGKTVYDSSPNEMAGYAVKFAKAGVNIIGACCGSSPDHIRAMSDALKTI